MAKAGMTKNKSEIVLNLSGPLATSLKASRELSRLKANASHHEMLDCRHPLAIYNVSTLRILKKLRKCCAKLEAYHHAADHVRQLDAHSAIQEEVIDYIELSLYSAAEHVDDVGLIARCFFESDKRYRTSREVRKLKDAIKPIRDRISGFTNAIKHDQSRIRLFSTDFEQAGSAVCLHGFFIETFHKGGVGPSLVFHASGERVISVTSLLWDGLLYLYSMSDALVEFLAAMDATDKSPAVVQETSLLRDCVLGLVRLPLYSFDETHPFEKTRFIVTFDDSQKSLIDSGLYGSLLRRWSKSPIGKIGPVHMSYEGDGVTKKFDFNAPTNLRLQHWD